MCQLILRKANSPASWKHLMSGLLGELGVVNWPEVPPYRLCSCVTRWSLPCSRLKRLDPKRFVTSADF